MVTEPAAADIVTKTEEAAPATEVAASSEKISPTPAADIAADSKEQARHVNSTPNTRPQTKDKSSTHKNIKTKRFSS